MTIHASSHTLLIVRRADYIIPPRLESNDQTIRTYRRQVYRARETKKF